MSETVTQEEYCSAIDYICEKMGAAVVGSRVKQYVAHLESQLTLARQRADAAKQERDRLAVAERRLRHAGSLLANVAFNLAQRSTLDANARRALDESRHAWDVEAAATHRVAALRASDPRGSAHE